MWRLLLPALIPAWRFFDAIGPSPRLEWRWRDSRRRPLGPWHAFAPRPAALGPGQILRRLAWNPRWNEALYAMRCAERILEGERDFPVNELTRRLRDALADIATEPVAYFEFRVVAHTRADGRLVHAVAWRSPLLPGGPGSRA